MPQPTSPWLVFGLLLLLSSGNKAVAAAASFQQPFCRRGAGRGRGIAIRGGGASSGLTSEESSPPSSAPPRRSSSPQRQQQQQQPPKLGAPICEYHQVTIPTSQTGPPRQAISVEDLTPAIRSLLGGSDLRHGTVTVISRHTTTAVTINERESRLARDVGRYLLDLAPPDERSSAPTSRSPGVRYLHNDIDMRPDGPEETARCVENGWDVDSDPEALRRWREQEPINAHSHLLSMLLGSSECIPVVDGEMVIGQWQSVLLVDLDGPRDRTVGVQLMGYS